MSKKLGLFSLTFAVLACAAVPGYAGTFSLPHFVPSGSFSLGLEPELTLSNTAGLGGNVKFTEGVSDLINVTGILGTGGGDRKFRAGASTSFDFFPDVEGQPGIGVAAQLIEYRLVNAGQLEITAVPYIHKAFMSNNSEIEPFLSVPFGWAFSDGQYTPVSTVSVGSMFKSTENLRYVIEFGIAVNNSQSYISGGLVYYH